jgi:hypothetical protein
VGFGILPARQKLLVDSVGKIQGRIEIMESSLNWESWFESVTATSWQFACPTTSF